MTPVVFEGCFGWLHSPPGDKGGDVGIVLCQSLMKEAMVAHCSLRLMADRLAAQGCWVLRFDYPDNGDSCDVDIGQARDHWASWERSVDRAADWLRDATGARRLVLCGMRIGATLATLAAARRGDVTGLVLIEPVVAGASYVRQLRLETELLTGRSPAPGENFVLHEFSFGAAVLDRLATIDLRQITLPAGLAVGLFAASSSRQIDACVERWTAAGIAVDRPGWDGLAPLLRNNFIEEAQLADVTIVQQWLARALPASMPADPRAVALPRAALHPPGCIETPLLFGPDRRLFGMLCRPDRNDAEDVVIIGNVGRDPHYGPGRQAVTLARRLALAGIASLRMDYAGLGDSLGPPGTELVRSHVYTQDRTPDINAAVDALQAMGFRRFALQGVCSGAYHALHAALGEPRISALILVNILVFTWPGDDGAAEFAAPVASQRRYARMLTTRDGWTRLVHGNVGIARAFRALFVGVPRSLFEKAVRALRQRAGGPSFARMALSALSKRGVRVQFLFSADEIEAGAFAREFGRAGRAIADLPGIIVQIVPDMDHGLMKVKERRDAEILMVAFLKQGAAGN